MDDKMQVCKKEYAKLDEKMNLQPYFVHIRQGAPDTAEENSYVFTDF